MSCNFARLAVFVCILLPLLGCSSTTPQVLVGPGAPAPEKKAEDADPIGRKVKWVECLVAEKTGLPVKVIVTSESVMASNDILPAKPGEPGLRPLLFFFPYHVFEEKRIDGVTYYRVGPTPREKDLIGWVSAPEVASWPSNVGLMPLYEAGARVSPLIVYAKEQALIDLIESGATAAQPIARAMFNGGHRPACPWPIVESKRYTAKDHKVYEIARIHFLGEVKEDFVPLTAHEASGRQDQAEVARARATVRRVDLVWVIDTTGSMAPYIQAVRQAVKSMAEKMQQIPGVRPDLSLALVAYRDHCDKATTYLTRTFQPETDAPKFLAKIAGLNANGGGDLPEAMYDGIDAALSQITWRQGSHRVVCVIADSSAHEPGDPQNPRGLSRQIIIDKAAKTRAKVFGLVTPLAPTAPDVERRDKDLLWSQLREIARGTGGEALPLQQAHEVVERVGKIMETEQVVINERAKVVEAIVRVGAADAKAIAKEAGLDIRKVTQVMEFLPGAGIDVKKLAPGVPAFSTGWVLVDQPGIPALERFVYLSREDCRTLRSGVDKLTIVLHRPEKMMEVFKLAEGGRTSLFDEFFAGGDTAKADNVTLDIFLAANHIPCGRKSCLRFTRKQLEAMTADERNRIRIRLETEILPSLVNDFNNSDIWGARGAIEYGWLREEHLP